MTSLDFAKKGIPYVPNRMYNSVSEEQKRKGVVLNLDNKGPGTHWTALKKLGKGIYKYFDPTGARISNGILRNKVIFYNPIQEQKLNETNCGPRVLHWLNENKKNS